MKGEWSKEVFAKNLRRYMERSGKTQRELAEIAGVSAPTFNEWLKAKKYPRIDKIERLAQYFGILKSDLIEEKKQPPEKVGSVLADVMMQPDLLHLVQLYAELDDADKKMLIMLAENMYQKQKKGLTL